MLWITVPFSLEGRRAYLVRVEYDRGDRPTGSSPPPDLDHGRAVRASWAGDPLWLIAAMWDGPVAGGCEDLDAASHVAPAGIVRLNRGGAGSRSAPATCLRGKRERKRMHHPIRHHAGAASQAHPIERPETGLRSRAAADQTGRGFNRPAHRSDLYIERPSVRASRDRVPC